MNMLADAITHYPGSGQGLNFPADNLNSLVMGLQQTGFAIQRNQYRHTFGGRKCQIITAAMHINTAFHSLQAVAVGQTSGNQLIQPESIHRPFQLQQFCAFP